MFSVPVKNLRTQTLGLFRRPEAGAVVLLYHRVADLQSDPQLLSVSPKQFEAHMRMISEDYHPISLWELASYIRMGNVPARSVVITFDDGYEDNLIHALPILDKYQVPATIFVATGNTDTTRGFYWDMLEDIFLTHRELPYRLSIMIKDEVCEWEFESASNSDISWNALTPPQTQYQKVYLTLCDKLRPLRPQEQRHTIDELCAWAGISTDTRSTHRVMSGAQLRELAESPMIDVGAHTIDHPILAKLSVQEQSRQITESKKKLEAIIDTSVIGFSYPYGTRSSYTEDTITLAAEAGLTCACSNFSGITTRSSDPYQIPRVLIRDWHPERVQQELKGVAA